jgi:copper transport protein
VNGQKRDRAFAGLLASCLLATTTAAEAHAVVTGTKPADGAVLSSVPDALRVEFNEPVSLIRLQIAGPDGILSVANTSSRRTFWLLTFRLPQRQAHTPCPGA